MPTATRIFMNEWLSACISNWLSDHLGSLIFVLYDFYPSKNKLGLSVHVTFLFCLTVLVYHHHHMHQITLSWILDSIKFTPWLMVNEFDMHEWESCDGGINWLSNAFLQLFDKLLHMEQRTFWMELDPWNFRILSRLYLTRNTSITM
jgi:hypothetical protein